MNSSAPVRNENRTVFLSTVESKALEAMLRDRAFALMVKIHKNGLDNDPLIDELNMTMEILLRVNPNA